MRKRIHPATVISIVALFFSLGGASLAASHYLITSVSQIKPSVRVQLHGQRGRTGARGIAGPRGPAGPQGLAGPQGPAGDNVAPYTITSDTDSMTSSFPTASIIVRCDLGDSVISGGFFGQNEVVTTNVPHAEDGGRPIDWDVTAHLDPNATSGYVGAWVLCRPSSASS